MLIDQISFRDQINNLASVYMVIRKDFYKHDLKAQEGDLVKTVRALVCEGEATQLLFVKKPEVLLGRFMYFGLA